MAQHEPVAISTAGERPVVAASGHVKGTTAAELAAALERMDPEQYEGVTVDLRSALSLDPLVVHALLHTWDRWGQKPDSVRVIVTPGPVHRYLDTLGLDRALDLVEPETESGTEAPRLETGADTWPLAQQGAVDHYHDLLKAARTHDLHRFERLARTATPICVAAGARAGGAASGDWCERCPLHHEYGGCRPIVAQMIRAANAGNWDAAQLLALALIAEVADVPRQSRGPRE